MKIRLVTAAAVLMLASSPAWAAQVDFRQEGTSQYRAMMALHNNHLSSLRAHRADISRQIASNRHYVSSRFLTSAELGHGLRASSQKQYQLRQGLKKRQEQSAKALRARYSVMTPTMLYERYRR